MLRIVVSCAVAALILFPGVVDRVGESGFSLAADDPGSISFSRDIRPLLSGKCYFCHGPDEMTREADLRLDQFEPATREVDGHRAITPGKPDQSELVRRILSEDPDEMMPPPSSNKSLTAEQKELLRRWIESGAEYEEHWAFVPPRQVELPVVVRADWPRNAIDSFILSRLEAEKLTPSEEADAIALVRRVYLDLIGLPPTPEEADQWAARLNETLAGEKRRPGVREDVWLELVNYLLDSPRYGERWARRWLDLARYADTNGYEKDRDRSVWPYRDWVVNALNADMPFDQFTVEQIAGDLLPDATIDQRIATGFHRNTMLNEEGGIDPLEFRFYAMTDRVATTGITWLGLTTGCCQCHTHKYDPLTHTNYYQLMAFLNNADEPDLYLPDEAAEQRYQQNLAKAAQLLDRLPRHWPDAAAGASDSKPETVVAVLKAPESDIATAFGKWLQTERDRTPHWKSLPPTEVSSNLPHLTVESDAAVFASGDTTKFDTYELTFAAPPTGVTAIRLEALPDARLPEHGPGSTFYEGRKGDFFLNEFRLSANGQPIEFASASHSYAKNQFGNNPVDASKAIDGDYQTGWSAAGRPGERSVAVFVLKEPLPKLDSVKLTMTFGRHFASSLGRFRLSVTTRAGGADAREFPSDVESLLEEPDDALTAEQRAILLRQFLIDAPQLAEQTKQIRQLRNRPAGVSALVLQERPAESPRPTFVHHRGEYLSTTDEVTAGTPEALHPFPSDAPRNRLGFAKWLVSRDNPLTARVVVNRHWAAFFGTGIVATLEDFGMQGESPSHPELLDWLAVKFVDSGWSLKKLHRLIVTSATYRQSAKRSADDSTADRLLSRYPRSRLEAEIIRDATLQAAGVLSLKMGGPPVRPPQPEGVTESAWGSPKWTASSGENRFRRSIYTYQKRTAPFAMFNTFDAPSGESCVARRDVSNTALQALTLLNDPMFLEAAQALGRLTSMQPGSDEDRVRFTFRRIATRAPSELEVERLLAFVSKQRERAANSELDAAALGAGAAKQAGDQKPAAATASVEVAVWTSLARALIGLDEALTRN